MAGSLKLEDFGRAFNLYVKDLAQRKQLAAHSLRAAHSDLTQFSEFLRLYKNSPYITRHHCGQFLASLTEQGLEPSTVNRKLSSIRGFFKFLLREEMIESNPLVNVVSQKAAHRLPKVLSSEQIKRAIDSYRADTDTRFRNRVIVELFYATGIRLQELIDLKENDVDWRSLTIRVIGKGSKSRIVPFPKSFLSSFQEWLRIRHDWSVSSRTKAAAQQLFIKENLKPLGPRDVGRIVNTVLKEVAEKGKTNPHILRHSYATHLVDGGADLVSVKELLGHTSLATTQIYTHVSPQRLRKVYQKAHPRAHNRARAR